MRPLGTWVVIGALALIGLFAARDALRGDEAPASSPAVQKLEKRPHPPPAVARPPQIADKDRLAAELQALGAGGVLYLTDANCRRYLLGLPALVWTTAQGLPGPDCTRGIRSVVSERSGLAAEQVGAETIEVGAEDWRLRFRGNGPAFTPTGMLTFLRGGRLYAWTVRCPHGVATTTFRGLHTLERCPRRVPGAPSRLRELVWLGGDDFAAVAGQELASGLLVVRNGHASTLFRSLGVRMGALEASPTGRDIAVRIGADLVVFDAERGRVMGLPVGADRETRAIAWSPDGRYAAVASLLSTHVYLARKPREAVTLPLVAVDVDWR
jgi:hypothetical protein